jgi:long-chain fatty acid transport protein
MIRALLDYQGEAMRRGRELGQPGTYFRYQKFQAAGAAMALLCLFPVPAHPTNGLSAIGFGAESSPMAGADLAVARDTAAMNGNPAGITQIPGNALDMYSGIIYPLSVAHRDNLGNDLEVWNRRAYVGGAGLTHRMGDSPVTVGIGLFAQGGTGNVYKNITTPFGTTDEFSSLLRIAKITPTVAYRFDEKLSLGMSLQVVYTDIRQKVFPETSFLDPADPGHPFSGTDVEMNGFGFGVKLGALYKVSDRLSLGAAYTSKIHLPLSGTVVANLSSVGLGKVTYRDASIEGMALPQEVDVGFAVRPVPRLLVAVKVAWLDWSGALKTSTLRAASPDRPGAPTALSHPSTLNWKDQYVFAIGIAHDLTEKVVLRAGYNFGSNPIPANTLNPLLAAIAEHHVTFGGGYAFSPKWQVSTAVEYAFNNEVMYHNPELPFGPGAEEESEYVALQLTLSCRW